LLYPAISYFSRCVLQIIGTSFPSFILPVVCIALVLVASLHDIAARTVPNSLVLILAAVGMVMDILGGHLTGSLTVATSVFVLASLCWRRGWMGGGDAKLLGAAALGIMPSSVFTFAAAVAIAGGVLAIFYLVAKRLVTTTVSRRNNGLFSRVWRVERWRIARGGPLPYACAIAAGAVYVNLSGGAP
jgi:prepilin peptidase CpaA